MDLQFDGHSYSRGEIASFFVDSQKGFTPLCPDELPVPGGHEITSELLALLPLAELHVASGDEHPRNALFFADAEHPQLSPAPQGENMDVRWKPHCVIGTKGAELLDGLPEKAAYDLYIAKGTQIDKHPYGACYYDLASRESTGVIELFREKGIKTVLVGGLATDYCVKTTVLQLRDAGFNVIVNKAACRAISPETERQALDEMQAARARLVDHAAELAQVG